MISAEPPIRQRTFSETRPVFQLGSLLLAGVLALFLMAAWWSVARGPSLLARTDNPRRTINDLYVRRGSILDRKDRPINQTQGNPGEYSRQTSYPDLSPVVGYTNPIYGQAGLEASLDGYLRGLQGNPLLAVLWSNLVYGQPPPGLDVRTSLDLDFQATADRLLQNHAGALVLLNAETGEILAMASHPSFNSNRLVELGESLLRNPASPLVNRAMQGLYPLGDTIDLFSSLSSTGAMDGGYVDIGQSTSPLEMSLTAAMLSAEGVRPAPRMVIAVNEPERGWVLLSAEEQPQAMVLASSANAAVEALAVPGRSFWQSLAVAAQDDQRVTWYLGGTLPDWKGVPLALAVLLEEDNLDLAEEIGQKMLQNALGK